jgi:hypothetical protein
MKIGRPGVDRNRQECRRQEEDTRKVEGGRAEGRTQERVGPRKAAKGGKRRERRRGGHKEEKGEERYI